MRLGEKLLQEGKITQAQLEIALKEQKKSQELIGKILNRLGFVSQTDVYLALVSQANIELIDPRTFPVNPEARHLIPYEFALKNKILPLNIKNGRIQIGVVNPLDIVTLDEVRKMTKRQIEILAVREDEIIPAIKHLYQKPDEFSDPFFKEAPAPGALGREGLEEAANLGSVIDLVDRIIEQAISVDATDIHIEPDENLIRVRYRIDGLLHQFSVLPKSLQSAITTRLKIMSNLNISETRIPQDGRADFYQEDRKIDLRASFFPCVFGENIVLRILDKGKLILGLEQLGFSPRTLSLYQEIIFKKNGIILVAGPTGSGKTTTLYTTISQLNAREQNILTLEDPVEYLLPMIQQSQINLKAGLTFASGLRSILRQDPDIILVGEIRDQETTEMAIRAALTGHLVFSTLHTNDAAGAVPRLLDMGAEPYLVASSLIAVISQRLVRVICPLCKGPDRPDPLLLSVVGWREKDISLQRGKGCPGCNQTGFKGRIGIFELLPVSPKIKNLIIERRDSRTIQDAAVEEGMTALREDGLQKVLQGVTTLDEILRVV